MTSEDGERGERVSIMFSLSERFKEAIGEYAATTEQSVARLIREAVAAHIGYDLKRDQAKRGRPTKYRNESERKIASRRKSAERRALIRALTEAAARQEAEKQAEALRASLVRKGVDPDS